MSLTLEWRHRIIAWREELARHFFVKAGKIPVEAAFTMDQFQRAQALEGLTFRPIEPGTAWGAKWEYGWFKGEFSVPSHLGGKIVALAMDVGAEAVVYLSLIHIFRYCFCCLFERYQPNVVTAGWRCIDEPLQDDWSQR